MGNIKSATKEILKIFLYIFVIKNIVACGNVESTRWGLDGFDRKRDQPTLIVTLFLQSTLGRMELDLG
jgi:hypothetical protein